jgi:hypothetical protein
MCELIKEYDLVLPKSTFFSSLILFRYFGSSVAVKFKIKVSGST